MTIVSGFLQGTSAKHFIPHGIFLFQTFGLFPRLLRRIQIIIDGGTPPSSGVHKVYIATEVVKVGALIASGCALALRAC